MDERSLFLKVPNQVKQCRRRMICPAAAFAKGGDNEEHLEVSLSCLHFHNIPAASLAPS
jgi:hypothetical protein